MNTPCSADICRVLAFSSSGPWLWGSAAPWLCPGTWAPGSAAVSFLLAAPRALGEAELMKSVGRALCGSMLTNSSSLELAPVGKTIVEATWPGLRDGTGEGQCRPQGRTQEGFSLKPPAALASS